MSLTVAEIEFLKKCFGAEPFNNRLTTKGWRINILKFKAP